MGTAAIPCLDAQARRAVPEPLHVTVGGPRALGEHDEAPAVLDQLARLVDGPLPAAARSIGNAPYTSAVNACRHHTSKK